MNRMLVAVAVVLTGLSGCATPARYVEQGRDGGVVAIPNNSDAWPTHNRREALALIEKHVGPDYEIVHQGEVAVGQRTNNNQQIKREQTFNSTMPFAPAQKDTIDNVTTTQDVTEFRITYRKKPTTGVGSLPPGMPGAPSPFAPPGGVTQTQYNGDPAGVMPAGGTGPLGCTGTGGPTCTK